MESILRYIGFIEDCRQQAKVKHKLTDIVVIVLFAKSANVNEGEKLKKGKTMRGNKVNDMKLQHVVSAWCDEDGFCLGQYVLCVKGNQPVLLEKITEYFDDKEFSEKIKANNGYKMTHDNCRSQIEKREYYQTNYIKWMHEKSKWSGLKTIGMEKKTVTKGRKTAIEI